MDKRQLIVLIADSAQDERAALRETLLSGGAARYSVIEAATGPDALELCRARKPDCVILDRDLPGLSVLELTKRLTAEDGSPACGVVALIGAGDARLAVELTKSGAHDCLEKRRAGGAELFRAVSCAIEKAGERRRGVMAAAPAVEEARQAARAGVGVGGALAPQPEPDWQRLADEQLRLLKATLEQSIESVIITTAQLDPPGPQIVYVNPAFTKMTGYTPEDVIGKTPRILQGPKTDRAVLDRLRRDCAEGRVFFGETVNYRKDGSEFCLEWSVGPVRDERGEITHFVATQRDVTERRRAQEELHRSEQEFRSLFDLSAIGMTQVSPEGRYLRVNRKLCQMLGYTEQEMLQLTLHEVTHPEDRDNSAATLDTSFTGEPDEYSIEKRYVRKDGSIIWVLINWRVIRNTEGKPLHTVANIQDITARKLAEEKLRASEAQLRAVLDYSNAVIFIKDLEGRYLRVNRWYEEKHGTPEAEVKGKTDYDLHSKEIADILRANDREVIEANKPLQFEEQVVFPDGLRHFVVVKFPLRDESGRPYAVCGIATDITDRKLAEEKLRLSEERRDLAMQAGAIGIFDWDLRANVAIWSERLNAIFGLPADETINKYEIWRERVHPEDLPACEASIREALEKKSPQWQGEYRIIRADTGETRWVDTWSRIFYDEQGLPSRAIGADMDITERKLANEALREAQAFNQAVLSSLAAHIAVLDRNGKIIAVNEAWKRFARENSGEAIADSVGANYLDACRSLYGTDCVEGETARDGIQAVLDGVSPSFTVEYPCHSPGEKRWFLMSVTPLPGERGGAVVAHTNITERKLAEEALQKSAEEIRDLYNHAPCGYHSLDVNGVFVQINDTELSWLGYAREEVVGRMKFSDLLTPDSLKVFDISFPRFKLEGTIQDVEFDMIRKDGSILPVLVSASAVKDSDGKFLMSRSVVYDITERKQAEAERERLLAREQAAREAAEAASRSKDEFLALVSHELRSPLNAMLGYARLLRYGPVDAQKVQQAVEVIERNGKAQLQLIEDLLDTARIISGKLRLDVGPVDLVSVIESAVQTIYPAADAKGITIQTNLHPKVGQITGDPDRLQQVVWNLLSNAVKFTPPGGRVEARLERVDPHVRIIISDTGKGISPDLLPYIFDRFRQGDASSARRYGGLGLGLGLVKYLVELHGGTVEAESAGEGRGATFKILLPVRAVIAPLGEAAVAPVVIPGLEEAATLAGVRALVVDDEDDARELIELTLARYGADVVAARSAAEAYETITTAPAPERPDVVVTDIGMPGEDGYSLLRRVREWERERGLYTPVVALTAYGRTEDRVRALMAGFQAHVAKPVEPAELAVVVASLARRPMQRRKEVKNA